VPSSWLLAAQLVVEFCIAMTSLLVVIVVGIVAFIARRFFRWD